MTRLSKITIEGAKRLGVEQELELHRAAYGRSPDSHLLRARLASLMLQSDLFEDVISLLGGQQDLSHSESMLLIQALLAAETPEANRRVCRIAQAVAASATTDELRAQALADLGKAQVRLGDDAARATLEHALALDPANKNACKRLAALLLDRDEPEAVLAFTSRSASQGAAHSRLFASRVLALARLGCHDEARQLDGRNSLGMVCELPAPPGWDSIDAFNRALAGQLLAHPGLRYDRYGTASDKTWRIDTPNTPDAPLIGVLLDQIRHRIDDHIARISEYDHPWVAGAPESGILHCWCVITEGDGQESWHVHQFGWLSGVYYVTLPDEITVREENGGCLAFGLPPEITGDRAAEAFGLEIVRPREGQMRIFPSHSYHRTYRHGSPSKRICIAYDVWPA